MTYVPKSIFVIYTDLDEIVGWCPTELETKHILEKYEKVNILHKYDMVYENVFFIMNNYKQMNKNYEFDV